MNKKAKEKRGFTLLETLIAMSIFIIIFISVIGIYLNTRKNFDVVSRRATVNNESRILIERIARDIRFNEIDYAAAGWLDPNGDGITNEIRLINEDGKMIGYKIASDQTVCGAVGVVCLMYGAQDQEGNFSWAKIDNVSNFGNGGMSFIVWPTVSPFLDLDGNGVFDSNIQPRVTISFGIVDDSARGGWSDFGQTTISSRVYKR
ncbi:MAG: prepilin-type N-terminal cleavage/methylation domain-containing protein [Patescibacteria group bacterium]|jgi:prepilin-type N-terminal cleavage/methylation domain-containing protein